MTTTSPEVPDDLPKLPFGPPPVGLVIASLLAWDEFLRVYPGMDRFWLPADGRPLPDGCRLARILRARGGTEASLRAPDLRNTVPRGATSFEKRVPDEPVVRLALASGSGPSVPTTALYYYVRYD